MRVEVLVRCTERACWECAAVPFGAFARPDLLKTVLSRAGWSLAQAKPTSAPVPIVGQVDAETWAIRCPVHTSAMGKGGRAGGRINI